MSAIKDAADWATSAKALARRDDVMASLRVRHGAPEPRAPAGSSFVSLAHAIVFQQLAGAAARKIWGRVEATVGRPFTPERLLAVPEPALLAAGLSNAKRRSLHDLAAKTASGELKLLGLSRLGDEEIIERLVTVRGIGRWTAEMFLLFKLRRQDVWPVTDFGVRKGFMRAYGLARMPEPAELQAFGERFKPYRSVAAWYLWRACEDQGLVATSGTGAGAAKSLVKRSVTKKKRTTATATSTATRKGRTDGRRR